MHGIFHFTFQVLLGLSNKLFSRACLHRWQLSKFWRYTIEELTWVNSDLPRLWNRNHRDHYQQLTILDSSRCDRQCSLFVELAYILCQIYWNRCKHLFLWNTLLFFKLKLFVVALAWNFWILTKACLHWLAAILNFTSQYSAINLELSWLRLILGWIRPSFFVKYRKLCEGILKVEVCYFCAVCFAEYARSRYSVTSTPLKL